MSLQGLPKLMDTFMEQRMKLNLIQQEYQKLVFCFYFQVLRLNYLVINYYVLKWFI